MNIFILDSEPTVAATMHTDKHVRKMILETSQMLSTAHHILDGYKPGIYKPAYANHPCTVWVRETSANYSYALKLLYGLHNEYKRRFGKIHASVSILNALTQFPTNIRQAGITPFALAMPKQYHSDLGAVQSYRNYYNYEKRHLFQWTNTPIPSWVLQEAPQCDYTTRILVLKYLINPLTPEGGK